MVRHTRKSHRRKRGGAATVFPLSYFDGKSPVVAADPGRDLLHASGMGIRPRIGGRRKRTRRCKKKGGFVPSVMGNFIASSSKYIVPMALFAGYKMIKKGDTHKKRGRRTRKR